MKTYTKIIVILLFPIAVLIKYLTYGYYELKIMWLEYKLKVNEYYKKEKGYYIFK